MMLRLVTRHHKQWSKCRIFELATPSLSLGSRFWQEKREEMGCFVSLGGWSEVREERIPY